MNCERVADYLTARAAQELPAATAAWVDLHATGCEACGARLARYTATGQALRLIPLDSVQPPPGFAAAVMGRIEETQVHARRRLLPIPPVAPSDLARIPSDVARVLQDNREAILGAASTAAIAAGAAWLAWRAINSRRPNPTSA